jgi:hypothetical protein
MFQIAWRYLWRAPKDKGGFKAEIIIGDNDLVYTPCKIKVILAMDIPTKKFH